MTDMHIEVEWFEFECETRPVKHTLCQRCYPTLTLLSSRLKLSIKKYERLRVFRFGMSICILIFLDIADLFLY